jgi:hypothetical protein
MESGAQHAEVIEIPDSQPPTPPPGPSNAPHVISLLTQDAEFELPVMPPPRRVVVPFVAEYCFGPLPRFLTPPSRPPPSLDAVASFIAAGNLLHKVEALSVACFRVIV